MADEKNRKDRSLGEDHFNFSRFLNMFGEMFVLYYLCYEVEFLYKKANTYEHNIQKYTKVFSGKNVKFVKYSDLL
jgi:hypothetical protein